jgi:SAM-dependent methyltransferase
MNYQIKKLKTKFKKLILNTIFYSISVSKRQNLLLNFLPEEFFYFSHKGFCPCCDQEVVFKSYNNWLRDNFVCTRCGSLPRERALMLTIEKYYPNWVELDIHETSPVNRGASAKINKFGKKLLQSQYYPYEKPGMIIKKFRNENLEKQTFEDESFDLVISQDVMEHVFNPDKAFAEIARTLKKGGAHIFTVPIINKHKKTEVIAKIDENGEIFFSKNPEYHNNPVDSKGSLVTMHWGYDIIDYIKEKSGLDTLIEFIDNIDYGIRAEFIEVLVSQKK